MEAKTILTQGRNKLEGKELNEKLIPYMNTTFLKDEMLNLRAKQAGKDLVLDRINKKVQKDRFSSLEYLLWYVKEIEDKLKEELKSGNNDDITFVLW